MDEICTVLGLRMADLFPAEVGRDEWLDPSTSELQDQSHDDSGTTSAMNARGDDHSFATADETVSAGGTYDEANAINVPICRTLMPASAAKMSMTAITDRMTFFIIGVFWK